MAQTDEEQKKLTYSVYKNSYQMDGYYDSCGEQFFFILLHVGAVIQKNAVIRKRCAKSAKLC